MLGRGQKHRFDFRLQDSVHANQLEFVLKVCNRAQAPQDNVCATSFNELRQQRVKSLYTHIFEMTEYFLRD